MLSELTQRLRAFNRFYTQRLGLLTDRYLGQDRPLADARVLFEIGPDGVPIRDLRRVLGLDSGYLSRVIRSLERAGLVRTEAAVGDRRLRLVRPTDEGRHELAEMDGRASAATNQLFERLDAAERRQLVDAIDTVERLLRVSASRDTDAVPLRVAAQADAPAVAALLQRVFGEQREHFTPEAFAVSTPDVDTLAERITGHRVWVVDWNGRIVGTVTAEIRPPACWVRSLAVDQDARGLRIAERLLHAVEDYATHHGLTEIGLTTTHFQAAAAKVYRRLGYQRVRRIDVLGTEMTQMRKRLPHRSNQSAGGTG